MNQAQGAAATGESDGTTSPTAEASAAPEKGAGVVQEQAPAPGEAVAAPTRLGALLQGMDLPPEVLATVTPQQEEKKEEKKEEPTEEEPEQPEAQPEEEHAEEQPEEGPANRVPRARDRILL